MGEINEEKWQMILEEYDKNNDGKVIILCFILQTISIILDFKGRIHRPTFKKRRR